jgi:hypothetical protein
LNKAPAIANLHTVAGFAAFDEELDDLANSHFAQAISFAGSANDPYWIAFALYGGGRIVSEAGYPNDALKYYQLAHVPLADDKGRHGRAPVLTGYLHGESALELAALKNRTVHNELAAAADRGVRDADSENIIAETHLRMGNLDLAHLFATSAVEQWSDSPNRRHAVISDITLAVVNVTTYSDTIATLATPGIFENRCTYRLLCADLQSSPRMVFGRGSYFDGIDVGDAAAHEFTAATLGEITTQDLRTAIGNPYDPARRPMNVAMSTLTLRHDRTTGVATFPLHRRDGTTVGHAGGMYQVLPVGIFQPAGEQPWNAQNDFSLWRCIVRELAEELRGQAEDYETHRGPIDYDAWPFAVHLTRALDTAQVRAFCVGIGVDPLTFATDILTVVTIDAPSYDELFGTVAASNVEGSILPAVSFTAETVEQYASTEPTQAAGAGLLRLAWRHRRHLLD